MIDKAIKSIIEEKLYDLHTCVVATVTRVSGNRLDVQPIPRRKYKDGREEPYPLLVNLPVVQNQATVTTNDGTFNVDFRNYQVGDRVLVVFSEKALDGVGGRKHSLSDGLVVGVI